MSFLPGSSSETDSADSDPHKRQVSSSTDPYYTSFGHQPADLDTDSQNSNFITATQGRHNTVRENTQKGFNNLL